jgi:CheY-like chemotaxis protein
MRSQSSSWPSPSFRDLGHSTYSAGSVVQALALLDDPGEIDLLFTDIRLPEGDLGGFELAEQARAKNPDLKVLYTTGDTITDGMKVTFVAGGEMLPKPYTAPELAAATAGSSGRVRAGLLNSA